MILPSARLIWVAAILAGAGVGASISASQASWFAVAAVVLVISLGDALAALRLPSPPALR